MYSEVKYGEKQSQNMVNKYYRTVNKDSLTNYQQSILHESQKAKQYQL